MNELKAIIETIISLREPAVLATLVDVDGSSYRRPGARMLVFASGRAAGTLTAGCLESEIRQCAFDWTRDGNCTRTFEVGTPEDTEFGWGSGCRGTLKVLFERLNPGDTFWASIGERLNRREAPVIATVYELRGASKFQVGQRIPNYSDARRNGTVKIFDNGAIAKVFVEVLRPPVALYVFGSGGDVRPVTHLAAELGWNVAVIDKLPEDEVRARFPYASAILELQPGELPVPSFDSDSAALVMTHRYADDTEWTRALLNSNIRYAGLLGAHKRTRSICRNLSKELPRESFEKLHAPVGLDIGAESPAEIATAIVAEIIAFQRGRAGGPLRSQLLFHRPGAHARESVEYATAL